MAPNEAGAGAAYEKGGNSQDMRSGPRVDDGHVGETELLSIAGIAIASSIFLGYPQTLILHGANAAWLIPVISLGPAALGWWAITNLLRLHPGESLMTVYVRVFGPWLGTLLNVGWIVAWWLILSTMLREFSDTVATAVLPTTPVSLIALMFMVAAAYVAYHGLESLSRAAWLLLPWLLFPTIALLLATYTWWDFTQLTPYLGTGMYPLTFWGFVKSSNYGELALLGSLAPMLRQQSRLRAVGYKTLFSVGAITTLMVFVYVIAWSIPSAVRSPFPFVTLARLAFLGRFVQRIESLFILVWVVVGVLAGAFAVYVISVTIAQLLRLPTFRPLLLPQGVIIFALMFLLSHLIAARNFDAELLRHLLPIYTVALPLVAYPLARWRARRSRRGNA